MKRILLSLITVIAMVVFALQFNPFEKTTETKRIPKDERIRGALLEDSLRTYDPALGTVPVERRLAALEEAIRLQKEVDLLPRNNSILNNRWSERGPNNIGGRTRALLVDQNDPTRNTLWAGGVSGGLWRSRDISSSDPKWEIMSNYFESMTIGSLAQDPIEPNYIYAGTGEAVGNSVRFAGSGILRSTDGGENWELLPASSSFTVTRSMLVHPETGDVYAATRTKGIQRSQDHGETWEKVAGYVPPVDFGSNNYFDLQYSPNGYLYASTASGVRRSATGDPGDWQTITGSGSGFPSGYDRIELTVSRSAPNTMYIIGDTGSSSSPVYASYDGGETWIVRGDPIIGGGNGAQETYSQAWYDLEITVNPFNENHLIAGEIRISQSYDGGLSWDNFGGIHVDHHKFIFDEEVEGVIYLGNDGGVYQKVGTSSPKQRNLGYNVTQFYGAAIHPEAGRNYYLAGAQDNNSLQIQGPSSPAEGVVVRGGDGMLCHIDQDQGQYQIVSSQYGNWSLSSNYGATFSGGLGANGNWVCASDIDKETKIAYIQTDDGDLIRWNLPNAEDEVIDIDGFNTTGNVSTVFIDDNISNRVYVGTYNGIVIRLDDANEGEVVAADNIGSFSGSVSSIDVELGNPDHILVTLSNYGVNSAYETQNGGDDWEAVGGNIPDMPVRWGIFSPIDPTQALLATEVGVWATELLDGSNTMWYPSQSDKGIPLTRVDQLRIRRSDNMVLAATYGRGLFTTDIFMEPKADMFVDRIGYLNAPLDFLGEPAINASSWMWDFGDGSTSTLENDVHSYPNIGTYPVSLTINDELTVESDVKILPDRGLPYTMGSANYGGDFEGNTEQYGVFTVSGSSFSRGNSSIEGKNGVHSGSNAFVLGIDEPFYQNGTHSMIYLPNFNMEEDGIYEFSFWSKFSLNNGYDGFRVEYSTNRGETWEQLGSNENEGWYNFRNNNLEGAGWPQGASYFSGQRSSYKNFKLNISFLSGNKDVAFRFVFKGGNSGNFRGVAIDDVEISKYEGALETKLLSFTGEYTEPTEITLTWLTQPEYYCQKFEVERSYNGFDFEEIETVYAEGVTSADMHTYSMTTLGQRNLQFFRLKVINQNTPNEYSYEFYSPTIVMRRKLEGTEVQLVFPNPIEEQIFLTFTDVLEGETTFEMFSVNGQLVTKGMIPEGSPTAIIDVPASLASGVYVLSVTTPDGNEQTFKLLKN